MEESKDLAQQRLTEALPLWQSHKRVHAAKIERIEDHFNAGDSCHVLHVEGGAKVTVTPGWLNRFNPKVGGYYVVYLDGYASFSPAAPFEEGYTRVSAE
jgi:hypothetical protein